jgi:hypothetical protein
MHQSYPVNLKQPKRKKLQMDQWEKKLGMDQWVTTAAQTSARALLVTREDKFTNPVESQITTSNVCKSAFRTSALGPATSPVWMKTPFSNVLDVTVRKPQTSSV